MWMSLASESIIVVALVREPELDERDFLPELDSSSLSVESAELPESSPHAENAKSITISKKNIGIPTILNNQHTIRLTM